MLQAYEVKARQTRAMALGAISGSGAGRLTGSIDYLRDHLRSLMRSFGYEIRRIDVYSQRRPIDFIRSRNIDVVVDVGANTGQYAERLRRYGYAGWIISAEPVAAVYDVLAARAASDPRWKVLNVGYGEESGVAQINISEASVFSSLRPQLPTAAGLYPGSKVVRQESIRIMRLDEAFPDFPKGRAFLKIDTQGYEEQVLKGGAGCISKFLGVQMELPIVHLYEGTWRFHDAIASMNQRGFDISTIVPVNFDPADPMSLLEVDCVFRRRP
jgi:FkbM family methyltransferase